MNPAIVLLVCGIYLRLKSGTRNALTVGDETATALGIPVARFRLTIFVIGALITGVMAAFSGIIGFVGLMMPLIVRQMVGDDYQHLLAISALCGVVFLVRADIIARTIMAPDDMPIGIGTGLLGGVFFVWLLGKRTN